MNNIQLRAIAHLTGNDTSHQRQEALHLLARDHDFLNPDHTEEGSRQAIRAFVEAEGPRGSHRYCQDGIGRFLAAVGVEENLVGEQEDSILLTLRVNVNRTGHSADTDAAHDEIYAIVSKLTAALGLVSHPASDDDPGWSVSSVDLRDWELD